MLGRPPRTPPPAAVLCAVRLAMVTRGWRGRALVESTLSRCATALNQRSYPQKLTPASWHGSQERRARPGGGLDGCLHARPPGPRSRPRVVPPRGRAPPPCDRVPPRSELPRRHERQEQEDAVHQGWPRAHAGRRLHCPTPFPTPHTLPHPPRPENGVCVCVCGALPHRELQGRVATPDCGARQPGFRRVLTEVVSQGRFLWRSRPVGLRCPRLRCSATRSTKGRYRGSKARFAWRSRPVGGTPWYRSIFGNELGKSTAVVLVLTIVARLCLTTQRLIEGN